MPESVTATVSIGANIAGTDQPLPRAELKQFLKETHEILAQFGQVVFRGVGLGYDPTTGASEPSATFVAVLEEDLTRLALLQSILGDLAGSYGQDSIALTLGATTFVRSTAGRELDVLLEQGAF